jgi:hypothetical protein
MVSVAPHVPTSAERAIDRLGCADRESLHPRREPRGRIGLDDQMKVVRLRAEVHDTKRCVGRMRQGVLERSPRAAVTE